MSARNTQSRRAILTGAATLTVAPVAALAALQPQSDAVIRDLFRKWIDLRKVLGSFQNDREADFDALVDQEEALAVIILLQPAEGLTGFGIKAFVAAASKLPVTVSNHLTVQVPDAQQSTAEDLSDFALAMDAVRLVPDVAAIGCYSGVAASA
ncbi:hypothetical protein [Azospirillum aestuarii]|uniref:hypothetical protein n=1 Tax=Azospirillum aestuarii TaxID=2802052 RepID=UPI004054E3A5